nr:arogenate dehydratase/prephenate dehydratase 2, chloroplastic [Ipomoea batatas]
MAATTATVAAAAAAAARSSSSLRFDLEPTSNSKPFLPSYSSLKPTLKRRRHVSIRAARNGGENQAGDAYGGEVKRTEPIELGKLVEEYPFQFTSKDLPNPLPRPLTSADLSNMASQGSRLRVAYQAVESWLVDRAVLPIENSLGGSIHRNYDLLLRHRLHIVGEVKLAIQHCLLASPGVKALAQCENTLTELGLVREAVDDTAGAAKYVAFHKLKDTGAVASLTAAKIYGLDVLAQNIQDDSDNVTRFLMLAREPIIPGINKPFKTSIVFSIEEGPGILFKALAVFAMRNINLTKIESRPLQKQALQLLGYSADGFPKYFPYLFYVDFEASMADERAQNALGHLKEFATFLRVLGSYPADCGMP